MKLPKFKYGDWLVKNDDKSPSSVYVVEGVDAKNKRYIGYTMNIKQNITYDSMDYLYFDFAHNSMVKYQIEKNP